MSAAQVPNPEDLNDLPADAGEAVDLSPDTEESDVEHFHWRVTKNLTRRIDQYLVDRVGYLSRNGVQRLIDEGLVKVNGRVDQGELPPARRRRGRRWSPRRSR